MNHKDDFEDTRSKSPPTSSSSSSSMTTVSNPINKLTPSKFTTKMSPLTKPAIPFSSPTSSTSSSSSSSSSSSLSSSASSSTTSSPLFSMDKNHTMISSPSSTQTTTTTSTTTSITSTTTPTKSKSKGVEGNTHTPKKRATTTNTPMAPSTSTYTSSTFKKQTPTLPENDIEVEFLSSIIRPLKPIDKVESQVDKEMNKSLPAPAINPQNVVHFGLVETELLHHFDQLQQYRLMVSSLASPPVYQSSPNIISSSSPSPSSPSITTTASTGSSTSPTNDGSVKKPRLLKKDTNTILLKSTSKAIKIPKKLEKVKQKCILYKKPDKSLRGEWTVSDDCLLLLLSQRFSDIESIYKWSQEQQGGEEQINEKKRKHHSMDWGDNIKFSRPFTLEEITKRWKSMVYDEKASNEAASMMALNPTLCWKPPAFRPEEEKALDGMSPFSLNLQSFESFLQQNRGYFHSSRTTRSLQKKYRDRLLEQDITNFPTYIAYLNDQRQKIINYNNTKQQQDSNNNQLQIIGDDNNNGTNSGNGNNSINGVNNMYNYLLKKNINEIKNNNNNIKDNNDLGNSDNDDDDSSVTGSKIHGNSESLNNGPTTWHQIVKSPPDSKEELQNDLILNPFQIIPKFIWDDDKNIESNDLKHIIKVEKEYEAEKEKDFKHLACIRGENIRYYMKQKDIIIGRDLSTSNLIDLDLREESEFVNRVSKKQFIIQLKTKTANFMIHNIGKNGIHVNGKLIPSGSQEILSDLSLIEVSDVSLIFEINKAFKSIYKTMV